MFIKMRRLFILAVFPVAVCGFWTAGSEPLYAAQGTLKIVATQALFADLARKIGGDKVEVKSVASPKFNVHFVHPRPSDVRNLAKADLFVHAGLDLEAWRDPLLQAAGRPEFFAGRDKSVDLSEGIKLLRPPAHAVSRAEGDIHLFGNPHYQMDPRNLKTMAQTILGKLKETDPGNAAEYDSNAAAFFSELERKTAEWRSLCRHCAGQEILSYHDDIAYLADFLGLKDGQFLEPKPGVPPTPKHLAHLESYAKKKGIKAIVMPTYFPKDAAQALEKKVGARVVTICQNAGEVKGTEDAFGFFDYNVRQISDACLPPA